MAALGVFVVVPCALLVFLAWQSVHSLHEIARTQRRDACRRELRDLGLNVRDRLANWLARAGEPLRARPPADPSFWIEAMRSLGADPGIRTVLALDPAGNLAGPWNGKTPTDDLPRLSSLHPAHAALRDARRARWIDGDPARALERYRQVVDEPRTPPAVALRGVFLGVFPWPSAPAPSWGAFARADPVPIKKCRKIKEIQRGRAVFAHPAAQRLRGFCPPDAECSSHPSDMSDLSDLSDPADRPYLPQPPCRMRRRGI